MNLIVKCFVLYVEKCKTNLLISLASTSSVSDGADDPGPRESRVSEETRAAGHRQAVRVRPRVRVRHGCDHCGLNHPLQVLTGGYGINRWNKGTARARHVYSVLLWRRKKSIRIKPFFYGDVTTEVQTFMKKLD